MSLVTISGGTGSGVEQIARLVAEEAKVELYDDRRLEQEALKMGIHSEELKGLGDKPPGLLDSLRYNPELYMDLLESVIYEVSRSGQGVIIGNGSQLLLRDFGCALHVLIHAPEPYRIRQLMDLQGLSNRAAEKMIHKSDHERRGFMRFAFHMDSNDLSLYDLVVNTEKMGDQGAAKLILEALRSQAIQECSLAALESMERMSLGKRVQAALLKEDFVFSQFHVEVPEKGVVQLTGFTTMEEDKTRMVDSARKVAGVSQVREEVSILPGGRY